MTLQQHYRTCLNWHKNPKVLIRRRRGKIKRLSNGTRRVNISVQLRLGPRLGRGDVALRAPSTADWLGFQLVYGERAPAAFGENWERISLPLSLLIICQKLPSCPPERETQVQGFYNHGNVPTCCTWFYLPSAGKQWGREIQKEPQLSFVLKMEMVCILNSSSLFHIRRKNERSCVPQTDEKSFFYNICAPHLCKN